MQSKPKTFSRQPRLLAAAILSVVSATGFAKDGKADFGLHLSSPTFTQQSLKSAILAGDQAALQDMAELVATGHLASAHAKSGGPLVFNPRGGEETEEFLRTPEEIAMAGCTIPLGEPTTGANSELAYFGPQPSTVNPFLVGQVPLLTAGQTSLSSQTVTLPLYRGELAGSGEPVWYIVTDTTDAGNAEGLGLNFSAKLAFSDTGRGARTATIANDGTLIFDQGSVDFSPERAVVAGAGSAFPPSVATPGSVGSADYSPLVRIENAANHIYNAPIIAFGNSAEEIDAPDGNVDHSIVHDSVVAIDIEAQTVTLELVLGFSFGRPVFYLSTDASGELPAALEGATFAPGLQDIETGNDDALFSAVERIFLFTNGAEGCDNPQRQGLSAAITNGDTPFNVLGGIPTVATDYSPLWDINLGEWTQEAIDRGYRGRLSEEFQILFNVENGFLTGPGGEPYGSIGAIVNCPIVLRLL